MILFWRWYCVGHGRLRCLCTYDAIDEARTWREAGLYR